MSQTVITQAFEQWKAQQGSTGEPVMLDEFIFANVPGLDPTRPIDRNEKLPPAGQIVYREAVTRKGVVNENAVVHSVVLGADVGDFSFNWIGLINKASGTLAMIVHAPLQQKLKTKEGQQGNVLTRSFLMEYNGAQAETSINTPAETWQIDFTARMAGMDERQRLENTDIYGAAAFFGDGWLVGKSGNQYFVTKGAGYVAGLRAELAANQNITVAAKPVKVWLDVCWTGGFTSAWEVQTKVTVAASLADYEQNGVKHHVFALASIDANGNITDLRPKGSQVERVAVKSVDNIRPDAKGNVDTKRGDAIQPVIALPVITNGNSSFIKIATIKDCGSTSGYFQISVFGSGNYGRPVQNVEQISVSCRGVANMTAANIDTYIRHSAIDNGSDSPLRVVAAPAAAAGMFDIYLNASGGWWSGVAMRVESISGDGVFISGPVVDRKMGANAWTSNKPANSFTASRKTLLTDADTGTSGGKIPLLNRANTWTAKQVFNNPSAVTTEQSVAITGVQHTPLVLSRPTSTANLSIGFQLQGMNMKRLGVNLEGDLCFGEQENQGANPKVITQAVLDNKGLTVNGATTLKDTTINSTGFINKKGIYSYSDAGNNYNETKGIALKGNGDLISEIYFLENISKYAATCIHTRSAGRDSWVEFRHDGRFYVNGSDMSPAGAIVAWLSETPPAGWLLCNGAGFNKTLFPWLALVFPKGVLPDLRGVFLRGKDSGRGIDPNRNLGELQWGQAPASAIGRGDWGNYAGRDTGRPGRVGTDSDGNYNVKQETEAQRETRPVNVSVNYIVRAA